MQTTVKTFPIRLPGDFHEQLKQVANEQHISIQQFIIKAILEKIAKSR